jgi:hypothetical protein
MSASKLTKGQRLALEAIANGRSVTRGFHHPWPVRMMRTLYRLGFVTIGWDITDAGRAALKDGVK